MRRVRFFLCLLGCFGGLYTAGRGQSSILKQLDREVSQAVAEVRPLVVHVTAQFDPPLRVLIKGVRESSTLRAPGLLVSEDGLVVTFGRRISESSKVVVEHSDGRHDKATVLGEDTSTALCVLKVEPRPVKALSLLSEKDGPPPKTGGVAIVVGHDRDETSTTSLGLISGVGRELTWNEIVYRDLIQLSAPAGPGDRGSAVIDGRGHVIGIVVSTKENVNLSDDVTARTFALPLPAVLEIVGNVAREAGAKEKEASAEVPWIGIRGSDVDDPVLRKQLGLEESVGVIVEGVVARSPAEEVGLKPSDIIVRWNGDVVRGIQDLAERVAASHIGITVGIRVLRAGESIDMDIRVSKW